jgi:hypothetical protein
MRPAPPSPETPSPRKKLPSIKLPSKRQVAAVLATVMLIAGFIGAFQVVRGGAHTLRLASGPAATATAAGASTLPPTATAAGAPTLSPAPTITPVPTVTPVPLTAAIHVTQNQDMRPACLDNAAPYTVALFNAGNVAANWHVDIPMFATGLVSPSDPSARPQPLNSPLSSSPFWATANPQDGSVAPGQTASFVMTPAVQIPCGGTTYHASVQLSFPSGVSQADIQLTYAGTGPAPYSHVVLVSGILNLTQPCPASGSAPPTFTFAIQNTGNATAYPSIDTSKDNIGINPWADVPSVTPDPPNPAVSTWLFAGETWTVTVAPRAGVHCDGTVYHVYVYINNAQGTSETMTFTDTFH